MSLNEQANNVKDTVGMYADKAQFLRKMIYLNMLGYYTALPCEVVAVNAAAQTVDIKPLLMAYYPEHDKSVSRAVIAEVPFVFQRAGDTWLSLPIKPGDTGLAIFCCRDISNWKEVGGEVVLKTGHCMDYNDAIFIPFVGAKAQAVPNYNPDYLEIVKNGKTITVKDGVLDAPEYHFNVKSVHASGTVESETDCISAGISGKGHIHGGVMSGDKVSGPPQG